MATAIEKTKAKMALAVKAGMKAVVEKYELPPEAYNVFTYYFTEEMEQPEEDEEEDIPNSSTVTE